MILKPNDTIGILGGGQLGRMLALAAAPLGLKTVIYQPQDEIGPAFEVSANHVIGEYEDEDKLAEFAARCQVVTYEFENVPAHTATFLAQRLPVRPGPNVLAITQERLVEKDFVSSLGIATAPYARVDTLADLTAAVKALGRPSILKTRRFGYDGKGQVLIRDGMDLGKAFAAIGSAPAILEGFVPFLREVSVVAARSLDGAFAAYDVCENEHREHILSRTTVPAAISPGTAAEAKATAQKIGEALQAVGVFTVEMFVVGEGTAETVVVNELAPRVHNSGHWTIEGAVTSQFEQHIRAIAGWPLGSTKMTGTKAVMDNLVGDDARSWPALLAEEGVRLHLYGKDKPRPGRKMGHATRIWA